ncbi:MAG TPA: hypothetical protein VGB54_07895 [Allosphingosinicella sp.]
MACALLASSLAATALIALWMIGSLSGMFYFLAMAFPFIFLTVLLLGLLIGLPLYAAAVELGWDNAPTAAAGGVLVAALLPALLAGSEDSWLQSLLSFLPIGGAGAAGGLVFWFILSRGSEEEPS